MSVLILLVNADTKERRQIDALLTAQGYLVTATPSLRLASKLLNAVIPDLLIADVPPGEFTGLQGLQLAVLSRRDHPNLPVIITHKLPDSALEHHAKRQGIAFIVEPLNHPDFLPSVKRSLGERRPVHAMIRQWPRKRVASVAARLDAAQAQLVDVSYGGLRLELRDPGDPIETVFDVSLPTAGVTLKAQRVWKSRAREMEEFWWGVKVLETDPSVTVRWRQFVDSVAESNALQ